MDLNASDIASLMQVSTDQDTVGFDFHAGKTWIYPTNYPVREYQYDIIQSCLYKNTLVSLPTGLGKTFIAAVVMYNYYRWYPTGKIVFMAPTKPLVRQQIDACYNIMAIPPEITSEMTGAKMTASRVNIWKEKRVFFITPHILQNDLETIPWLGEKIRLVVIDEAHKALGKQANCEVIRKLREVNEYFRVLALSATPGSNFKNVTEVISNLLISHIECRTDNSIDVVPYVFNRTLETIVVPLGGRLQYVKEQYVQILDTYTRPLIKFNVLSGNCAMMTKGKILLCMRDYKENCRNRNNYNQILCNLNICITLYHGYELLIRHGLRNFLTFFDSCMDKPLIRSINGIHLILEDVRNYLGPTPNVDGLPDGTVPDIPMDTVFGHPKYYKLGELLSKHFRESPEGEATKVMVFCEYRESVMEAYALLLTYRPLIRPKIFIGKGAGVTQAQQLLVIKMFREGRCNTLIATCIGEEGIDVGEVDLIVCFDISSKSPVRMVQRMGRTGRKRNGRVIILVTEGKEQQTLQHCLVQKTTMNNLLSSNHIKQHFYSQNPRMIPDGLEPSCNKMFITVPIKHVKEVKKINSKQKNTVKNMFDNIHTSQYTEDDDDIPEFDRIPETYELWCKTKDEIDSIDNKKNIIFTKNLEKQRTLQISGNFSHSTTTDAFISLLKFADKKKYNLPTQTQIRLTQKTLPEQMSLSQINNFVQVDIRNMFKRKTAPPPVQSVIEILAEESISPKSEIVDTIDKYIKSTFKSDFCRICDTSVDCTVLLPQKELKPSKIWSVPDFSIVENITEKNLEIYMNTLEPKKTLNETEIFKHNMSEFLKELNTHNATTRKENTNINDTLNFLKLTNIEDIFSDNDSITSNNEKEENIYKLNLQNCTPQKNKKLIIDQDVSPILASGRVRKIKSKINSSNLSQESSTPNNLNIFNKNNKEKNFIPKSFNFLDFESFAQNNNKVLQENKNEPTNEDLFEDDVLFSVIPPTNLMTNFQNDNNTVSDIFNSKVMTSKSNNDLKIMNSPNYNENNKLLSQNNIDKEIKNNSKEIFEDCVNLDTSQNRFVDDIGHNLDADVYLEYHRKSEILPDLNKSTVQNEKLNISCKSQDMFDESLEELKNINNMFDIADESLFQSDSNSEDETKKQNINTKDQNYNMSIENNKVNDKDNLQFKRQKEIEQMCSIVDESIFVNSDNSEDNTDTDKLNTPIETNVEPNKLENTTNFDPDATILLSSDDEYNIEVPCCSNKTINLSVNKTNTTLLSVTQLLNCMNDQLDNSHKENCSPKYNKENAKNDSFISNMFNVSCSKSTQKTKEVSNSTLNDLNIASDVWDNDFDFEEMKSFKFNTPIKSSYNKVINNVKLNLNNTVDLNVPKSLSKSPLKRLSCVSRNISRKLINADVVDISILRDNKKNNTTAVIPSKYNTSQMYSKKIMDISVLNDDIVNISRTACASKQKEKKVNINNMQLNNTSDSDESLLKFSYSQKSKLQLSQKTPKLLSQSRNESLSQHSPIKFKKSVKRPIELSDSDDDFQMKPFTSQRDTADRANRQLKKFHSDVSFDKYTNKEKKIDANNKEKGRSKNLIIVQRKKKKKDCPFIDEEAELEDDEHYVSDSENEDDIDALESSFIHDTEMSQSDNTDIHAKYLQSVKSPVMNRRGFKIPALSLRFTNVYSQVEDINEENTYLEDSFCVGNEDSLRVGELSYLEQAEAELKRQRKERKKLKNVKEVKKRKRIIIHSDSD